MSLLFLLAKWRELKRYWRLVALQVKHMRLLDKLLGSPLCLFANLGLPHSGKTHLPFKSTQAPRLLIIHLSEMGSMVLAQPAIEKLRQHLPLAQLYFLSFPPVAELLQEFFFDERYSFTIDPDNFQSLFSSTIKAIRKLRRLKIEAVIDFEGFSRFSSILSALIAPQGARIGYYPYAMPQLYRGHILTHKIQYNDHLHASRAYLMLLQSLWSGSKNNSEPGPQMPLDDSQPQGELFSLQQLGQLPWNFSYTPQEKAKTSLNSKLQTLGLTDNTPIVIVNPNSSDILPLRRWDLANYAQVIRALQSRCPELKFLITGTAREQAAARQLTNQLGPSTIIDLSGQTNLAELLALFCRSKLLITNDSGPAHLAAACHLPSVILFGPETPWLFAPLGNNSTIIYKHFACSPCVSPYNGKETSCSQGLCLKAITPETVINACWQVLQK